MPPPAPTPNRSPNGSGDTPSPAIAGLTGHCPRCGQGALFRRGLVLRGRCPVCDLNYAFIDTGDGPAVFAIFILGFVMLGLALIAEFQFHVPVWFHIVAWGLLTPLFAILLLRGLKGLLIGLQYRHKAELGQLAKK
jgi:uncharacterized protein (DUF983 family)